MANNSAPGSSGDAHSQQADTFSTPQSQDSSLNLDFGPPVTGASNSSQKSQETLPNLDFGPPVTNKDSGTTDTGGATGTVQEEPFVGSGGVGSAEYLDTLRRGHEQAGGEYTSDLENPDSSQGGSTT